jgi:hypothetical protein
MPANGYAYRDWLGGQVPNYDYVFTFSDKELDTYAMAHWWNLHGPNAPPNQQDYFKNDKWSRQSTTSYSVIARLLKQGGAEEFHHVHSPSVGKNWRQGDLTDYASRVVAIIASGGAGAANKTVRNRDTAQR